MTGDIRYRLIRRHLRPAILVRSLLQHTGGGSISRCQCRGRRPVERTDGKCAEWGVRSDCHSGNSLSLNTPLFRHRSTHYCRSARHRV